jgi:hypothetical protein
MVQCNVFGRTSGGPAVAAEAKPRFYREEGARRLKAWESQEPFANGDYFLQRLAGQGISFSLEIEPDRPCGSEKHRPANQKNTAYTCIGSRETSL